jgi:hypothetical protein
MNYVDTRLSVFGIIFPIVGIIYFFSHFNPLLSFHYAIAFALVFWSLSSLKKGSLAFLIAMIAIDDFPRFFSEKLMALNPFISIYTIDVSGVTLYLLLAMYFVIVNLVWLFISESKRSNRILVMTSIAPEIKMILGVGIGAALVGGVNLLESARIYVSDLGFFINILLGFLIIRNLRDDEKLFRLAFYLLIYSIISKVVIVSLDATIFSSTLELVTIAPGTDGYLVGCVLIFSLLSLQTLGLKRSGQVVFFLSIIFVCLLYFILTASRGRMLVAAISLLIFLISIRKYQVALSLFAIFILILVIIQNFDFEYINYFLWKLNTFNSAQEGGESSLVRVISFKNIMAQQLHTIYQLFVGAGLGGHFTSQYYPFPYSLLGADAFPEEWIIKDTFFKPHTVPLFILLKTGFIGLVIFYGFILTKNFKDISLAQKYVCINFYNRIVLVLSPLILPLFFVNFSSKLQLVSGALIGFIYFSKHYQMKLIQQVK